MSNFDGPMICEYDHKASAILGGDYWRHRKSFRFYLPPTVENWAEYSDLPSNRWAHVSAGELTDKGSVPKILRSFIDRDGKPEQAFALHDKLVEYLSVTHNGVPETIDRAEADAIMFYALRDLDVDADIARIIYHSVRSYSLTRCNTCPSTYALKRQLEADYNFEGLE